MPDPGDHGVPRPERAPEPDPLGRGPVPVLVRPDGVLLSGLDDQASGAAEGPDELRWSFGCDLAEALAGLDLPSFTPADSAADQEQFLAELEAPDLAADADGASGGPADGDLGGDASGGLGRVADALPAGPGLAAWVAQCPPEQLSDADLPAAAAALRRVTSWAQAAELAVVAEITARSAARDPDTGVGEDGCPAAVTRDAAAQAGLALTLSPGAAAWWTDLSGTLRWRLPAVAAALSAGRIDLTRARIIVEATSVLDEEAARAVADQMLSAAGGQTYGQLRAAVARAVILADPQGAEERRQAAERRARVGLYPGDHHTATLTGMNLPAVHAAAAMARLTALARAMQAAGAGGGLDLLRAHAYLGLLLNTLPPIPPRPDAPPDDPPPDDPPPDDPPPDDPPPDDDAGDRGGSGLDDGGTRDDQPGGTGQPDQPPHGRSRPRGPGYPGAPAQRGRTGGRRGGTSARARHSGGPSPGPPDPGGAGPEPGAGLAEAGGDPLPPAGWPTDTDAPADDGVREPPAPVPRGYADERWQRDYDLYDEPDDPRLIPAWPGIPATGPAPGALGSADHPARGLVELTMAWSALALGSASPATVSRIGPVTAEQARLLAAVAASSPATRWRIILTDTYGHTLAVTSLPRRATRPARQRTQAASSGYGTRLIGRVTITVPITALDAPLPAGGHPLLVVIAMAAARTLLRLRQEADSAEGCTHDAAVPGYRPTAAIRDYVAARDQTCRYPCCRQPAWHADLDHTHPWHQGGRTCPCNLGALCRTHHILKQLQGWTLTQPRPGVFQWTTPTGRTYTTEPDVHPA